MYAKEVYNVVYPLMDMVPLKLGKPDVSFLLTRLEEVKGHTVVSNMLRSLFVSIMLHVYFTFCFVKSTLSLFLVLV